MIHDFEINKLKYDFMGGTFNNTKELSFHHTIIKHRDCPKYGLGEGYLYWNGSILVQKTSHEEAHVIEQYDEKAFAYLTSELIDINAKGHIDMENLIRIRNILLDFEYKYRNQRTKKGKKLIKTEYITKRIQL